MKAKMVLMVSNKVARSNNSFCLVVKSGLHYLTRGISVTLPHVESGALHSTIAKMMSSFSKAGNDSYGGDEAVKSAEEMFDANESKWNDVLVETRVFKNFPGVRCFRRAPKTWSNVTFSYGCGACFNYVTSTASIQN